MTGAAKRKGDRAEREVAQILTDMFGYPCRRMLGAGRQDDVGDIEGLPDTTIQVANYRNIAEAIRIKPDMAEQQRINAGNKFAATFLRRQGGKYVVVLTLQQFEMLWREATAHRDLG